MKTIAQTLILLLSSGISFSQLAPVPEEQLAKNYFSRYINECKAGEIRCMWFPEEKYTTTCELTIDIESGKTQDLRDIYNWSLRGSDAHLIYPTGIRSLGKIIRHMPDSQADANELTAVSIAYFIGKSVEVRRYQRSNLPLQIRRIYDIAGGEIEGTFPEENAAQNHAPPK